MHALVEATARLLPGDTTAVCGPSGSGKSTLLHLVAGLVAPTSGQISWPGLDRSLPVRHQIGVVFQAPSLVPALSVVENVELPLLLQGTMPTAVARDLAHAALRDLELDGLAGALPEEISGGQAQRVAVARVLAGRPRLICADEPTGRLDLDHALVVTDLLLHTAHQLGAPLLVATHDPRIADRLATTWPILDGRLTQEPR
ncbi:MULTISPECIES: ABC transporter ATP-binding protein [unclassified Nocardioides]|uniref:ABC transporter ATP-binding protein n=1 Tax=unclassified Nocardioides TaxID=2615069 RepID=UPI001EE47052|nr:MULTISPECIES: ABC transporter ATP-binding protein [unclassified Nocardioides]